MMTLTDGDLLRLKAYGTDRDDEKPRMKRPCSCGCDASSGVRVGYLQAVRNRRGVTVVAQTEEQYQAMLAVFGGMA